MNRYIFSFLILMTISMVARYHVVTRVSELERLLDQYTYSIVCFASSCSKSDDVSIVGDRDHCKVDFRSLQQLMKSASTRDKYTSYGLSKKIGWLVVDVSRDETRSLIKNYSIVQIPTCFIFEHDEMIPNRRIVRPAASRDVIKALEDECGSGIKELINDYKEEDRLNREERIASNYRFGYWNPYGWNYSWYPRWRWGYPRWDYGFYLGF